MEPLPQRRSFGESQALGAMFSVTDCWYPCAVATIGVEFLAGSGNSLDSASLLLDEFRAEHVNSELSSKIRKMDSADIQ